MSAVASAAATDTGGFNASESSVADFARNSDQLIKSCRTSDSGGAGWSEVVDRVGVGVGVDNLVRIDSHRARQDLRRSTRLAVVGLGDMAGDWYL